MRRRDAHPGPGAAPGDRDFEARVGDSERRLLRAREGGPGAVLATIGMVGWTVSLPMLGGLALGLWIDGLSGGGRSFGIMLMIGGLFLGCWGAWAWIRRRSAGDGKGGEASGGGADERHP